MDLGGGAGFVFLRLDHVAGQVENARDVIAVDMADHHQVNLWRVDPALIQLGDMFAEILVEDARRAAVNQNGGAVCGQDHRVAIFGFHRLQGHGSHW